VVSGFDLMFRHTLELSPLESENKKKNWECTSALTE
jgi:hypothetical protein